MMNVMDSGAKTILLFGDFTDNWYHSMVQIHKDAATTPWLRSFLEDVGHVVREGTKGMDPQLLETLGGHDFISLQEVVEMYRDAPEEVGLVQCIMAFIMRAVPMLRLAKHDTTFFSRKGRPWAMGISGGLVAASTLAISHDFESLYDACLVAMASVCRICKFAWIRSRAVEETVGVWGWAVMGISSDDLDLVLAQFQESLGIHEQRRCRVGIRGDRWSTVIGPPAVVVKCLTQCPALRTLAKKELPVRSLQHNCPTTREDHVWMAGESRLHGEKVHPDFRLFGLDEVPDGNVAVLFKTWRDVLRVVADQTFSRPLDLVQSVGALDASLQREGWRQVHLSCMGPSCHEPYVIGVLRKHHDLEGSPSPEYRSLQQPHLDLSSRVAVVGISGRAPGSETSDVAQFWDVMATGQDLAQEIPKDRFDADELFDNGDPGEDGCKSKCKHGCFIKKPGHFDARFFHISPREALLMDPGCRIFLMQACEALEMSGYSAGATRNINPERVSVYFGQSNDDGYITAHHEKGCDAYTLQTAERAFPAGRLALHFGWEGPTWAVDCACSTACSMVHLACRSLLNDEVDMAVVGAANVMAYPHGWCGMSKAGVLSNTGNCKTFRDDADGYCRGDFVGAVVLKRLQDALDQNDNVLAVIAGSGRNQSGNASSITSSDQGALERLFRKVLRDARLAPTDISYVEMHGTGTPVGDPVEMAAVASVLGRRRLDEEPLVVGALKANFGHSEAASGLASLLKSVLMFQKRVMPPQVGMPHALNQRFPPLDKLNIQILSEPRPFFSAPTRPRRILINNFDAAGGNACLVIEDASASVDQIRNEICSPDDPRGHHVVVASARTPASHRANKRRLLEWLQANPHVKIQHVAYTTTARRVHHCLRSAYAVSSTQELMNKLELDLASKSDSESRPLQKPRPIVFVFTGQGSYYAGMGAELYGTSPVFRETVDMCVRLCAEQGFPPFLDMITGNMSHDNDGMSTAQTQLAVLTLEIALASFWRRIGLEPCMVIGHSLGEYAALHVAGVLTLSDVLYLVGRRAMLLMQRCETDTCSMLSVSASAESIQRHMERLDVAVSCINSPNNTVVSATVAHVAKLQAILDSENIKSRRLSVPYAFHSPQVDPILDQFVSHGAGVAFCPPKTPVASTLLASVVDGPNYSGIFSNAYLGEQTRRPVDFVGAIAAANAYLQSSCADHGNMQQPLWLELGPAQVCGAFIRKTLSSCPDTMSTLEAGGTNAWASVSRCLAALHISGVDIDWLGFHAPFEKQLRLMTLPSYAWDTKDYWLRYTERKKKKHQSYDEQHGMSSGLQQQAVMWTCAQYVVREENKDGRFTVTFGASLAEPGMKRLLQGHVMRRVPIVPGSACSEAALSAALYAMETSGGCRVDRASLGVFNVILTRPLTPGLVGADGELRTTATLEQDGIVRVSFQGVNTARHTCYNLGSCDIAPVSPEARQCTWDRTSYYIRRRADAIIQDALEHSSRGLRIPPYIFYSLFSRTVDYQCDDYRCVTDAYVSSDLDEAAATVVLRPHPPGTRFTASPYWGEALAHLAGFIVNHHPSRAVMPTTTSTFMFEGAASFERSVELEAARTYLTYARVLSRQGPEAVCDIVVFDGDKVVMQFSGVRFREVQDSIVDALGPKAEEKGVNCAVSISAPPESDTRPKFVQHGNNKNATFIAVIAEGASNTSSSSSSSSKRPVETDVFQCILESIAKETGVHVADLTDHVVLAEVGVDSIMSVEISAVVKSKSDFDLLPSFILDYPTVGHLRRAFGPSQQQEEQQEKVASALAATPSTSDSSSIKTSPSSSTPRSDSQETSSPCIQPAIASATKSATCVTSLHTNDTWPPPKARVVLLQGNPKANTDQARLYLMADGCGTVSNYINLMAHKFSVTIYGIDSPFLRCPLRLTVAVGIAGVAQYLVDALLAHIQAQPTKGPIILGGYSGGATLAYEVTRQLAEAAQSVDGLLLIDMRCPLPPTRPECHGEQPLLPPELVWKLTQYAFSLDATAWDPEAKTSLHLGNLFACVASYHPPPLPPTFQCPTAIIWCAKGMLGRLTKYPELRQAVVDHGMPTEPYPGFIEDPRMGHVVWGLLNKTDADIAPNGWEMFVAGGRKERILCLSIDADHHETIQPTHTHLTHEAIEKALEFILGHAL